MHKTDHKKVILAAVARTAGYAESSNKAEFNKGAEVAVAKAEEYYRHIIEGLEQHILGVEHEKRLYLDDLQTVSRIITSYRPQD